jgi:hypothetical protein
MRPWVGGLTRAVLGVARYRHEVDDPDLGLGTVVAGKHE